MHLGTYLQSCIDARCHLCQGISITTLAERFCAVVNNPNIPSVFERNLWHIPDYQGIQLRNGEMQDTHTGVIRSADITSAAQLRALQVAGAAQMQQVQQSFNHAAEAFHTEIPTNLPPITISAGQQPPLPVIPDIMGRQFGSEVLGRQNLLDP